MANQGSLHGVTLLSAESHTQASAPLEPEFDCVLQETIQFTQGGFGCLRLPGVEEYPFIGWVGAGGSMVVWNEQLQIGFSYVMNAMGLSLLGDRRGIGLLNAVVDVVAHRHSK